MARAREEESWVGEKGAGRRGREDERTGEEEERRGWKTIELSILGQQNDLPRWPRQRVDA